MARAPSYDFERRERAKAKDAKRAAKNQAKREQKAAPDPAQTAAAHQDGEEADVANAEGEEVVQRP